MRSNEGLAKAIESPQISLSWGEGKIDPAGRITAEFGLTNAGKSRAFLREFFIGFRPDAPPGNVPDYPPAAATLTRKSGGIYPPSITHLRVDDVTFNLKQTPVVYGYFRFTDIFDRTHIARFCGKIREDLRGITSVAWKLLGTLHGTKTSPLGSGPINFLADWWID